MKSFTTLRNLYGDDTKDTTSANLTYGDEVMNDFHRRLLAKADWPFLHRTRLITSVAPSTTFTAATSDLCTVTGDTINIETGVEVSLTTSASDLPAGLATSTRYFMIFQSSTTFELATSLANALAGTQIDITDTGTGTHTLTLATHDNFQPLPHDIDQVESISILVGTSRHSPKPAPSKRFWDQLHRSTYISDTPIYWFIEDSRLKIYPRQASDGNIISIDGKIRVADLNIADFTTGNIDIVTNGSIEVTGAGTPGWTQSMVGRFLRVTHSNTDSSSGDGEWYEINAVESSTVLTLRRPYGGRSLTTGATAAYIIGQMPLLPEAYQALPEMYGAFRFWSKENDMPRAAVFKEMLDEGMKDLFTTYAVNDLSMIADDGREDFIINPNLTITL